MPWFCSSEVPWMWWMWLPSTFMALPCPAMPPALSVAELPATHGPSSLLTTRHGPALYWKLIGAASRLAPPLTSMRRFEIDQYSPEVPAIPDHGPAMPPEAPAGVV